MTKGEFFHLVDKTLLFLSVLLLVLLIWDSFFSKNLEFLYNLLYTPIWIVFTVEYCLKLYFSKNKFDYIRGDLFGIFVILFPFLRPFRLLAASRFGLVVLTEQINNRLPWVKKYRILEIFLFGILILILSSDLLLLFEKSPDSNIKTFGDAIWFSIATISTTGYGDFSPKTTAGRAVAISLIVFGVSAFQVFTAKLASIFVSTQVEEEFKAEDQKIEQVSSKESEIEDLVKKVLSEEKKLEAELEGYKKRPVDPQG